jgi:MinD-like ATPase involved in chromosome partitioning or flagellar assembly
LLASPQPKDGILLKAIKNFEAIIKNLPFLGQYVILDLGSSLPPITQTVINLCDEVIVILEPVPQNVRQTKKLIQDLLDIGIAESRIRFALVNRIRSSVQMNWTQVQEELGYKIATVFTPAPELAYQSAAASQPLVMQQPGSITAQQFDKLATLMIK